MFDIQPYIRLVFKSDVIILWVVTKQEDNPPSLQYATVKDTQPEIKKTSNQTVWNKGLDNLQLWLYWTLRLGKFPFLFVLILYFWIFYWYEISLWDESAVEEKYVTLQTVCTVRYSKRKFNVDHSYRRRTSKDLQLFYDQAPPRSKRMQKS